MQQSEALKATRRFVVSGHMLLSATGGKTPDLPALLDPKTTTRNNVPHTATLRPAMPTTFRSDRSDLRACALLCGVSDMQAHPVAKFPSQQGFWFGVLRTE